MIPTQYCIATFHTYPYSENALRDVMINTIIDILLWARPLAVIPSGRHQMVKGRYIFIILSF